MIVRGRAAAAALLGVTLAARAGASAAQDADSASASYGPAGLVIQSDDGNYEAQIRFRLQFRGVIGSDDLVATSFSKR